MNYADQHYDWPFSVHSRIPHYYLKIIILKLFLAHKFLPKFLSEN